jgi:hypothetical protein
VRKNCSDQQQVANRRQRNRKIKKYALIGLATVSGGVLLGLTGGLAAPLIGAGVGTIVGGTAAAAAIGSVAGAAVIGSLFGLAGAGLTGDLFYYIQLYAWFHFFKELENIMLSL